jgi:hypothetical protein
MYKTFYEWLKEKGLVDEGATTTANVANYSQPIGGGYTDSPALKDTDEFWGPAKPGKGGQDKQAHDYGLAGKLRQLGVGPVLTEKPTGTNKLRNGADDLPIDNSKPPKKNK